MLAQRALPTMASHPMGIAQQPQIAHARVHLAAQRAVTCIVRRASVACRTATPAADAALLNGAQASTSESCCAAPQSASFAARTAAAARRFAARAGPQLRSLLVGPSAIPGIAGAPPAFLAAPLVAATLPGGGFADLFTNRVFMVGFWAWFCAQFGKIFTRAFKTGRWELRAMIDSGGMPSSHSAFCVGVTTAIALQHGLGSSLFALGLCFSLIVMYDAAGVRRHAGKQVRRAGGTRARCGTKAFFGHKGIAWLCLQEFILRKFTCTQASLCHVLHRRPCVVLA